MQDPRFEEVCRDHYAEVVRVAFLITGDRQEALDVAQETFARAYERWGHVSAMENPVGWLVRVAANLSLSHRRRTTRTPRVTRSDDVAPSLPADPTIQTALATLTPAQRAAVVLRFYLDMSIEDTAKALGKKEGTVRALTSQGVRRLREQLGTSWMEVRDE